MDSERSCMHQGEMTKWKPLLVTILVVPGDRMMVERGLSHQAEQEMERQQRPSESHVTERRKKESEKECFSEKQACLPLLADIRPSYLRSYELPGRSLQRWSQRRRAL